MRVRVTSRSNVAGDPYGLKGAPGVVIPDGASGGEAALASLGAYAMNAPVATAPAPPRKNARRSSNPFPAASRASSKRRSRRRGRIAVLPVEVGPREVLRGRRECVEGSRAVPKGQDVYSDDHDGASSGSRAAGPRASVFRRRTPRRGGRESRHRRIA